MRGIFKNKFPIIALVVFLLVAGGLLFGISWHESKKVATSAQSVQKSYFVGSNACKECHIAEYKDWKLSDHFRSMQPANGKTVLGDFDNVTFRSKGFTNKMFKNDSAYCMVLENREGRPDTFKIKYTFGYYPLQQYLIEFPKGRYQGTHVAWDSRENKWFSLYPDLKIQHNEWLHWTGGSQTWNNMCADCHSTNLQKNFDEATDSYKTTWDEIDVSCEACHGPGSEHVRLSKKYPDSTAVFGTVYLGTNSTQSEQIQFCARCHSRRSQLTNQFDHDENWMQQYSPDILRPGLYFADGQIQDEVYVWGSFTQSKMYRNGVRCTDCHNPHTYKRKLQGNQLCYQCHKPQVYGNKSHHFHETGTDGAKCESCHMPGRNYMVNDYRPDHSFRVPRPDLSVKYNVPNACNKCHNDKTAQWAADWVVKWYGKKRKFHYSEVLVKAANQESSPEEIAYLVNLDSIPEIAKASAVNYLENYGGEKAQQVLLNCLSNPSILVRRTAIEGLGMYDVNVIKNQLVKMLYDTARVVHLAAFNTLAGVDISTANPNLTAQFDHVKTEFFDAYKNNADFPSEKLFIAQYYYRTGQINLAQKYYEETLKMDNYQNMARMNLAVIYNSQKKNGKASVLLKKVIEQEPKYDPAYYSLGLLYAEMNKSDSAAFYLKKCTLINNQNAGAFYNLGLIYQQQNQPKQAEETFLTGLKNNRDNERLLYAISFLYLQEQKTEKAGEYARKLVKLYPDRQEYFQLLQRIEQSN
ncbi:MAG TPA: multiheme c-type cytochrome [Draconibacterium sp.]|nr:multiheme c-type cytochrome [Draconibacterium sp.]